MSTEDFIKHINKIRLENKNKWYFYTGTVNNKQIQLKAYETWIQILRINGVNFSSCMDMSVKQFKDYILNSLNHI